MVESTSLLHSTMSVMQVRTYVHVGGWVRLILDHTHFIHYFSFTFAVAYHCQYNQLCFKKKRQST